MYAKSRLPDPVRAAAVRAGLAVALTLVLTVAAVLCSVAEVWAAFPLVLSTIAGTVVATWGVLDVLVTRQVWVQRHGVVSEPSSVARGRFRAASRNGPASAAGSGRTPDADRFPGAGPLGFRGTPDPATDQEPDRPSGGEQPGAQGQCTSGSAPERRGDRP